MQCMVVTSFSSYSVFKNMENASLEISGENVSKSIVNVAAAARSRRQRAVQSSTASHCPAAAVQRITACTAQHSYAHL